VEDVQPYTVPTASKAKISHHLSYPIGAEAVSLALASAAQSPELKLRFYFWSDLWLRSGHYEFLRVEYLNNATPAEEFPMLRLHKRPPQYRWEIVVQPVPRLVRHRIKQYILESALPAAQTRYLLIRAVRFVSWRFWAEMVQFLQSFTDLFFMPQCSIADAERPRPIAAFLFVFSLIFVSGRQTSIPWPSHDAQSLRTDCPAACVDRGLPRERRMQATPPTPLVVGEKVRPERRWNFGRCNFRPATGSPNPVTRTLSTPTPDFSS